MMQKMSSPGSERPDYDLVVVGGAFSGTATAVLVKRWNPDARVLVIERSEQFGRRVGEATVEISSLFLHRVLGIYDHLSREHLPKHGLRYWLADHPGRSLAEMTEVGPREVPRLPSFQLDRARLDQYMLALAADEGIEVRRPARLREFDLGWPESRLTIEEDGEHHEVTTRWVVDATGRQAVLARRMKLHERFDGHPTAAMWGRWRGVADLDSPDLLGADPRAPGLPEMFSARRLATNHFTGYGWWCWVIPLAGGETSIGLVWNKKLWQPPSTGTKRERYEAFLRSQAGLKDLVADAEIIADESGEDFNALHHLPYRSRRYMDRGWALVGDAASFIDPYYSPGLDHAAMSIFATARVLEDDLKAHFAGEGDPERLAAAIESHNEQFEVSYDRWFEAIYRDKYELMGDAELITAAYLLDTALYYMGVVSPAYEELEMLRYPTFGGPFPHNPVVYRVIGAYRRRLTTLARFRRRIGIYGRKNAGWRLYGGTPGLRHKAAAMLISGLKVWLGLEVSTAVERIKRGRLRISEPRPVAMEGS
ncbi:MAG: NAD(P)/FAD-dependent oxidoreductase [Acidobacteriota bacterium]